MITVKNVRHCKSGVYVGRENTHYGLAESPLCNPYHIGKDGDRDTVIAKYDKWVVGRLADHTSPQYLEFMRLVCLARMGDLTLLCWCKPLRCHADVLKHLIENHIRITEIRR